MNIATVIAATATVLLLSTHAIGLRGVPKQGQPLRLPHTHKKRHAPQPSVPSIARLLGVRVGYNGQDALEHQFGDGLRTLGGHPHGRELWKTRHPTGIIATDGFNYNDEGLALESLSWGLSAARDADIPYVRRVPRHAGWLGVIVPGMTMTQVSQLTAGRLPAPKQERNTWTWTAIGFVRPSPVSSDVYTQWTAKLTFKSGVLNNIDVKCEGGYLTQ